MPHATDIPNAYTTVMDRAPSALTADGNGTGASWADHEVGVCVELQIGAVTGTTPTLTVQLQQSKNDNSADASGAADAYSNVSGASTALTDSDANSVVQFMSWGYSEKYLRLNYDVGGTNPSFLIGATIKGLKKS